MTRFVDFQRIRLVGGSSDLEGRLEIYHNGQYGTVCDDDWDLNDAIVVCRELGHKAAIEAVDSARFGAGAGNIWLNNVQCTGYEARLQDCPKSGWDANSQCGHHEDAGVRCTDTTVRLVGGTTPYEGRLEVFHEGQWGTICDDSWDPVDANVACAQLGYTGADKILNTSLSYGARTGLILMDGVKCTGQESQLEECQFRGWGVHDCLHSEDVGIRCSNVTKFSSNSVKLFGGSDQSEGTVEVLHFGLWKGICDDNWDIQDAKVVCRQLGFQDAKQATKSQGGFSLLYWMDEVDCSGSEGAIEECAFDGWGKVDCGLGEGAGVVCSNDEGSHTDLGIILVPTIILSATVLVTAFLVCWTKHAKRRTTSSHTNTSISYSAETQSTSVGTAGRYSEKSESLFACPQLFVETPEPPSYGDAIGMPVPQPLTPIETTESELSSPL